MGGFIAKNIKKHFFKVVFVAEGSSCRFSEEEKNSEKVFDSIELRNKMAVNSLKLLGIKDISFHNLPCGILDQVSILKINKIIENEIAAFNPNNIFTHRKFRSISSESDTKYLTPIEIKEIVDLDLKTNLKLDRVRDMFIISCNTALRYSDIVKIKPEDIVDDMIDITQFKTKDKVAIPIMKEVGRLLSKYNYSLPKISNQKFNEYLYEVVKKCKGLEIEVTKKTIQGKQEIIIKKPKYEFISSHTARRSFATNEYMLRELSIQQIMSITGHKTERSFYKYIRMTPKENAEQVRIIWKDREEGLTNASLRVV
jgi:integrase